MNPAPICASTNHNSPHYPRVTELWDFDGRIAFVAGNCISDKGGMWLFDWESGDTGHNFAASMMTLRADRTSLSKEAILARFHAWAKTGNSHAMWWLGWWHEGSNHPKSVWYYIAAIRANQPCHGWSLNRLQSDAQFGVMCADTPPPDISFLQHIPELNNAPVSNNWHQAVQAAHESEHTPASKDQIRNAMLHIQSGETLAQAALKACITEQGLSQSDEYRTHLANRLHTAPRRVLLGSKQ